MKKLFFGFIAMVKSAFEGSKKSFALGASVIALAVLVSAYTAAEKKMERSDSLAPVGFVLIPDESITDPASWSPEDNIEVECPIGEDLCGISVDPMDLDANGNPLPQVLTTVAAQWKETNHGNTITGTNTTVYKKD